MTAKWIKKAMGPGWIWDDEARASTQRDTKALELTPRETFRMWAEDWAKQEPARPAIAIAEHGIHFPHLDCALWEHLWLPRSLEQRVPVMPPEEAEYHNDEALKRDRPHCGFVWPVVSTDERTDDATLASQVCLVFSSEQADVLALWAERASDKLPEGSHVAIWSLKEFDATHFSNGESKSNVDNPHHFSAEEFIVVHVKPEHCGFHDPLHGLMNQLRRRCASFYARVPVYPDRLRFLTHLNTQPTLPGGHLAYLLSDEQREAGRMVNTSLIKEIARATPFFHYSDLARLFLRTVEQWQRDKLCRRKPAVTLELRLRLVFCRGQEKNPQQRQLQDERMEETKVLDRFFPLPAPAPSQEHHALLLSDQLNVVALMDQREATEAQSLLALDRQREQQQQQQGKRKAEDEEDQEMPRRPLKRARTTLDAAPFTVPQNPATTAEQSSSSPLEVTFT